MNNATAHEVDDVEAGGALCIAKPAPSPAQQHKGHSKGLSRAFLSSGYSVTFKVVPPDPSRPAAPCRSRLPPSAATAAARQIRILQLNFVNSLPSIAPPIVVCRT